MYTLSLKYLGWFIHLQEDFVALGLTQGKVTFQAKVNNRLLTVKTDNEYNDNKWHFVTVNKDAVK